MDDPRHGGAVKAAIALWLNGAVTKLKDHPEQMAELRRCFEAGDSSDIRIVYHVKGNALTIETLDASAHMFSELFREMLMPNERFALPDGDTKH